MKAQDVNTSVDELLEEWRQKAWLQRIFLPGDFLDQVTSVGTESMVCQKTTMEYLLINDRVEEKTVTTSEARKYSTDLDYRPQGFKQETLRILANARTVRCGNCGGRGKNTCSKCSGDGKVTCSGCSGRGEVNCNTTMNCGSCGGSGKHSEQCTTCGGSGGLALGGGRGRPCPSCSGSGKRERNCDRCRGGKVTCDRCGGKGSVGCSRCNRSGILTCSRCGGSGILTCNRCGGSGELVNGTLITRKFSCSTERTYQLTGLAADEFKNGLAARHFQSMAGDLVLEQFQTPARDDIVHQRRSVHTYDVFSHHYTYRDAPFGLNRITSASALKYVTSGVPLSKVKILVAGAVVFAAALALAVVAVLILL